MVRAPCCENEGLKKGRWTDEEDDILFRYIQANGEGSWRSVPKNAGLQRCGKSCRLRWINYLRPDLKRGNFSGEEEDVIIRLHASLGNRWSLIAGHLPGRTDNEIKNYWNSHLSRKHLTDLKAPNDKTTDPAEVTAKWKLKRGRSRQRASGKNVSVSVPVKDMNLSMSMPDDEENDSIVVEKGMYADVNEESFQITEYINEEGKDNTPSLNTEEPLIFSTVHKPSDFNEDCSDVLFSFDHALSVKLEETEIVSTFNSSTSSANQKRGIKPSNNEVDTIAAGDNAWADWDWKSLVNGQKLIEEDEMLSMLLDDSSDFQLSNQQ